ncbi:MAG: hypothetical protein WB424_12285 [Terracidiphilus sp.]
MGRWLSWMGLWGKSRETERRNRSLEGRLASAQTDLANLRADQDKADAPPSYKAEYDREAALNRETMQKYVELRTERDALLGGRTRSGLTPVEMERLAQISMAAGKLAAEAAKVMVFGWQSPSPLTNRPGYADLERAMGRMQAVMGLMVQAGDVRGGDVMSHAQWARKRLGA